MSSRIPYRYLRNPYVRLCQVRPISLGPSRAGQVIKEDKKVFPRGVSVLFKLRGCNVSSPAAPAVKAALFEVIHPNILWAFGDFWGADYSKLCLSQGQIIDFASRYPDLICHGYGTWAFFQVNSEFFLASLHTFSGNDPNIDVHSLSEIQRQYSMNWRKSTILVPLYS